MEVRWIIEYTGIGISKCSIVIYEPDRRKETQKSEQTLTARTQQNEQTVTNNCMHLLKQLAK